MPQKVQALWPQDYISFVELWLSCSNPNTLMTFSLLIKQDCHPHAISDQFFHVFAAILDDQIFTRCTGEKYLNFFIS